MLEAFRVDESSRASQARPDALVVFSTQETYRRDGPLDPERMLAWIRGRAQLASAEGFSGIRLVGEMAGATRLGLSPKSVETHRAELMRRLGVQGIAALVRTAITSGLVPREP